MDDLRISFPRLDFKAVADQISDIPSNVLPHVEGAMTEIAEAIITDAKEIVPVDTGSLKNSGRVEDAVPTESGFVIRFGFGGFAAGDDGVIRDTSNYAVIQHEIPFAGSPKREGTPRRWKYLEEPAMARLTDMDLLLARTIESRLRFERGQ